MQNDTLNRERSYLIQSLHLELKRGKSTANKVNIDWNRVKVICLKIAEGFLKETNQFASPTSISEIKPISLDEICSILHIKKENYSYGDSKDERLQGEIFPTNTGFIVRLNLTQSDSRIIATLAHEIGHSLFYDSSKYPPKRVYFHLSSEEEWICWDFARSILLPTPTMNFILSHYPETPSATEIILLAKKLGVSISFLLKRAKWDLKAWEKSTIFTGYLSADKFIVEDVHKSIKDKNLTITGKNGILDKELQQPLNTFIKNNDSYLERKLYIRNHLYKLELSNLTLISDRVIGILMRMS